MMATLSLEILNAAHNDGLLPKRLSANQKLYLHRSILTANQLYWMIAEEDGLDVESLGKRSGLNENTLKQYTRWMLDREIIYTEKIGQGGKYYFFTKQKHKTVKAK